MGDLEGPTRAAKWLVDGWLVRRVRHKLHELDCEFKEKDRKANDYHFKDCSDMVNDFRRGFELLQRMNTSSPEFKAAIEHASLLHDHLREGLTRPWTQKRRSSVFVKELNLLLASTLQKCNVTPNTNPHANEP